MKIKIWQAGKSGNLKKDRKCRVKVQHAQDVDRFLIRKQTLLAFLGIISSMFFLWADFYFGLFVQLYCFPLQPNGQSLPLSPLVGKQVTLLFQQLSEVASTGCRWIGTQSDTRTEHLRYMCTSINGT